MDLQIFKNEDCGEIRIAEENGKVWFCGSDVAKALGYSNTKDALARHCKEDGVAFHDLIDSMGREQQAKFINEGNTKLYYGPDFTFMASDNQADAAERIISRYCREIEESGIDRVILGTAAVTEPGFLEEAARKYGRKIAVGMDIKDGFVAIKGWTEKSELTAFDFCQRLQEIGIETIICTDISRDGAMRGTNLALYRELSESCQIAVTASGGVSTLADVAALRRMELYGAIVGKAYYTGAIDLRQAIEVAK